MVDRPQHVTKPPTDAAVSVAATESSPPARVGVRSGEQFARLLALIALLYVFLVGVDLLSSGMAGLGGGAADALFGHVANPLAGLAVGVLATVLVQSSSVSTSTIVVLVGSGVLTLPIAVPMIMGANIGTTVTSTLASLGAIRRRDDFRRAVAGATVHDLFNLLAVAVLLPLELLTGVLSRAAIALSGVLSGATGGEFNSPIKEAVGRGGGMVESVFAGLFPGTGAAVMLLAAGLALIFVTLVAITWNMRTVVRGAAERSLNAVLGRSGTLGILFGIVLTVAVQSSSITTSLLVPMMAAGVLTLPTAYPITLGANVGTTVTALIAALAVPQIAGLQIALVHLLFNLSGILLFFPLPAMRRIPIAGAEWLAEQASRRRGIVLAYVAVLFLLVPAAGVFLLG